MLSERFDPRRNSLNALRLVLAMLVIVSHAPLIAEGRRPYHWADLDIGGWAVAGFFAVSGWLITGSRLHLPLPAFLWRRALRILPGFWLALLVTAVAFVPLAGLAEPGAPDPLSAAGYVVKNLALWVVQPSVAGSLTTASVATWNLSLWTLFWEMLCYVGVGLVCLVPVARRRAAPIVGLAVLAVLGDLVVRTTEVVAAGSTVGAGLRLGSFFLVGAALRMTADRVPVRHSLAAASVVALAVLWAAGLVGALGQLPIAYLCLYGAIHLPLERVGARNDLSYGVYVYGFPVAQLLALAGAADLGMPLYVVLTGLAVLPLAALSWFLVERRAIGLKELVSAGTTGPVPAPEAGRPDLAPGRR